MRIITVIFLIVLSVLFGYSAYSTTLISKKSGNWSDRTTWQPEQVPTSLDIVKISALHTVVVDINAVCFSLIVGVSNENDTKLIISNSNILSVIDDLEIYGNNDDKLPTVLSVGNGTLNVGADITFFASPGYANLEIGSGIINVTGNLDFNASGQGNIKRRSVDNSGVINLGGRVLGTGSIDGTQPTTNVTALPNDYYRSNTSGDWGALSSWKSSRDGTTNWVDVTNAPNGSAKRIEIKADHKITVTQNSPAANLFVYGILDCINNKFINGPGPFTLNANALFITGNPNGITLTGPMGAIQVDGKRTFSPDANFTFNGSSDQETGDGLPSILNGTLKVHKSLPSLKVSISYPTLCTKLVEIIKGNLISDGKLTLHSNKSSYAQIGKIEVGDATVSGAVNVQSFFTGTLKIDNRGTRMISFPVKDDDEKTIYQQLQEKMVITGPGGPSNGFDSGGGNPNAATLTTYFEPARPALSNVAVPHITTKTTPGKAVHVYFRGNRDNALGNKVNGPVYAKPEDVVANYRGTVNQGPVSIAITHTANVNDSSNGLNAIGNPYPAAIDWEQVYLDNKLTADNKIKIENEIRLIKPGAGMVTRKRVGGTLAVVPVEYTASSQFIQPGQGFYIKKTAEGDDSFTFLESQKSVNGAAARVLAVPSSKLLATQSVNGHHLSDVIQEDKFLRIKVQQGDIKDETLIIFKDGLSSKFDNNDAFYLSGNAVMVGSLTEDNRNTSINAMPDVKDIKTLKLYVNANVTGATTLSFTDLSVAKGYQIFLIDAVFPEELIDLKKQSSYDFNINKADPATYGNTRFSIIFKPEPIEAPATFTARKVKTNVQVDWTSLASRAVRYFEVEVSVDQQTYMNVGTVQNAGNNEINKYSFTDKSPTKSIRYYRLKQFNYNGTVSYSDVRIVDLTVENIVGNSSIVIYPNPSLDQITVQLNNTKNENIEVSIFDLQGKKLRSASFNSNEKVSFGVNQFAKGVYLLEVKDAGEKKIIGHSKFVVGI